MNSRLTPVVLLGLLAFTAGATTVSAISGLASGANIGWLDGRGEGGNGAVIGDFAVSGCFLAASPGRTSASTAPLFVRTSAVSIGAEVDSDGLTDAWERAHFGRRA